MSDDRIDLFHRACGASAPLELEVEGPGEFARRVLHQPFALIGRDPGADVPLADGQVGRRHAYLQVIAGRVFCVDLASRSGTHWEGEGGAWLKPGGAIRVGPFRVRLAGDVGAGGGDPGRGDASDPLAADRPGDGRPAAAWLEFPGRAVPQPPWRMDRMLVLVGKAPLCKVRLSGPEVSRVHCALVRTPAGLWAVDLLGRGGIAVNGRPGRWAGLGPGDELRVGRHRVRMRPGPPASVPALLSPGSAAAGIAPAVLPAQAEPSLAPLIEQFGQMQQQMFDQFQQAMMMMFQMFGGLHREQMDLVREELEQIRRLTRDLQSLQTQADIAHPGSSPADHPPPGSPAPTPPRPPAEVPPGGPEAPAGVRAGPSPASPGDRPDGPAPRAGPRVEAHPAENLHALLVRRMEEIQGEREGRWRKILNLVTGA